MPTKYDFRFMDLQFKNNMSRLQMNDLINRVMEENEEALVNSKDRDNLLYDLIVGELSGSAKDPSASKSTETVKEADTNSNKVHTDSEELRRVPLPAHNDILGDKKFKYNTFASLMACSNKNIGDVKVMEFTNYLYDNKIEDVLDFIYDTTGKRISERTFNSHMKNIIDSGYDLVDLQNTPNGLVYLLRAEYDGGYFVTIPFIQLKELLLSTNKNALKIYVFLKDYLKNAKQGEFTTIDRSFIARSIGLSTNTHKGADVVSTMVNGLARLGYIEIKKVNESYVDKDGNKAYRTINSYRIRTLEEWEAIKKQAGGGKSQ